MILTCPPKVHVLLNPQIHIFSLHLMGELQEVIRHSRSREISITETYDKMGRGIEASTLALSYHTTTYTMLGRGIEASTLAVLPHNDLYYARM